MNIEDLYNEVNNILKEINPYIDGEHLWDNYQKISAHLIRLNQIHNDLAWMEIVSKTSPEAKKFRTMIVDPTIERLEKVASFESRKITARSIEWQMEKG